MAYFAALSEQEWPRAGRRRLSSSSNLSRRTVEWMFGDPSEAGSVLGDVHQPGMKSEEARLQSFHRWPVSSPASPTELAQAGFYHLGTGDKVQCFSCGGVLKSWARGEHPMQEHRKFFPFCHFILGRDVGNRPKAHHRGRHDCTDGQILGQMTGEDTPLPNDAAHPDMKLEWVRVSTFRYWPSYAEVQPQPLARAGFFYTGHSDHVKCFYCDGGLRNWEEDDDPWTEHAKWFPRCEFLNHTLGPDYIRSVQEMYFNGEAQGNLQEHAERNPHTERNPTPCQESVRPETQNLGTEARLAPAKNAELPESTEEQLHRLQEERMCKICMDHEVSIVFVPCGHLAVCMECAPGMTRCPICRALIQGRIRTFMS